MSIKGISKTLTAISDLSNQEQPQSKTTTPSFVPSNETNALEKRANQ